MPKYLDLFAGAGGLSEGFIRAGYEPIAHVEMDAAACYTLRTRMAYHWLKKGNNLAPYTKYLAGDIPRKDFYALVPKEILDSVLNIEASNPVPTPLLGHRCRSSQEITGSPTPFSTSNHYLWICPRASFSLSNPNIAA